MSACRPLEHWPIERLIPYPRNARTHTPAQIARIAGSIREFGFTNPILIDPDGNILAGHARWRAAEKLKLETVPVVLLTGLSATQRRAYILADNKLALDADWDDSMLAIELEELQDAEFDLNIAGFDSKEVDRLLGEESADNGKINIPESFEVVVECGSEEAQRALFERLTTEGLRCRVLTL